MTRQYVRLREILGQNRVDLGALSVITSSGMPRCVLWEERAKCWRLLLGIEPIEASGRATILKKKRATYAAIAKAYFTCVVGSGQEEQVGNEWADATIATQGTMDVDIIQLRQIRVDLARTKPDEFAPLLADRRVQFALTRALYVWGLKHPASGYVQGINDIVIPIFLVYLLGEIKPVDEAGLAELLENSTEKISEAHIHHAECDTYMSMQLILGEIQDYFVEGRPGIQDFTRQLGTLVARVDPLLSKHLKAVDLRIEQFCVRWANCLLTREFRTRSSIRLLDTFIGEGIRDLKISLLFISLSLLIRFAGHLVTLDFEAGMMFLQNLPSSNWDDNKIDTLVAEAFIWKSLYSNSPKQIEAN